jgi:hypothetical protein
MKAFSGCSVARLARLLWEQEVAGSNPATPTDKKRNQLKINWLRFFIWKLPHNCFTKGDFLSQFSIFSPIFFKIIIVLLILWVSVLQRFFFY